jgi:hypothetical protein
MTNAFIKLTKVENRLLRGFCPPFNMLAEPPRPKPLTVRQLVGGKYNGGPPVQSVFSADFLKR